MDQNPYEAPRELIPPPRRYIEIPFHHAVVEALVWATMVAGVVGWIAATLIFG